MSTNESEQTVVPIEGDMRDLLRAKRTRPSDGSQQIGSDCSSLVSQITVQSVHEIDHLIQGLQGVREKLNDNGDRLYREIAQHVAFSQSIIQLTEIISAGLASVKNRSDRGPGT
jgi:hypothetical protein